MEEMAAKQKSSLEDMENEISELGYDYAWRSVDRATAHFDRTDSKISTMGGSVGVSAVDHFDSDPNSFSR